MKKTLRTLFAVLALTLCLCLPAFAQEAKPAQPAAKEDKTVTDLTGFADFMRNSVGFTTNFGGPYRFTAADHRSPAQAYGADPAEGAVAVLRLFSRADDRAAELAAFADLAHAAGITCERAYDTLERELNSLRHTTTEPPQ